VLLITIALVVVAFVLLIVGFIDHSLGFIYTSIACSVGAAAILIVVGRVTRRRALRLSPAGPSPAFGDLFADVVPGGAGSLDDDPSATPGTVTPEDETPVAPAPDSAAAAPAAPETPEVVDGGDEYIFPIEAYDELRVGEIIPLLVVLDPDELEEVRARELEGRARVGIVRRIDVLLRAAGIVPPPALPSAVDREMATPQPPGPAPTEALEAAPAAARGELFPIAGYDKLRVIDILPLLVGLNHEQLQAVEARETAGGARTTVLNRVRRLLR